MLGNQGAAITVVAVLLFLSVLPTSMGQDAPGLIDDEGISHAYLHFQAHEVDRWTPGPPEESLCEQPPMSGTELPIYGLSTALPAAGAPGRVHSAPGTEYASCATMFAFPVEEAFILGSGTTVTYWVICDQGPVVAVQPPGFNSVRIDIIRNQELEATRNAPIPSDAVAGTCPSTTPVRFDVRFDDVSIAFEPGDRLQLSLYFFVTDPLGQTIYLVDSFATPSGIHGPGLPGALRANPQSPIAVEVAQDDGRTGPGNVTTYDLVVHNAGAQPRQVDLTVEGPEAWVALPSVTRLALPANGSVAANITVGAPGGALAGDQAQHTIAVSSPGERVTYKLTTLVAENAGRHDPSLAEQLDAAGREDPGGANGGLLSDLGVEITGTVVVATLASVIGFLRRGG